MYSLRNCIWGLPWKHTQWRKAQQMPGSGSEWFCHQKLCCLVFPDSKHLLLPAALHQHKSLQVPIIWIFSSKLKKMFTGLNSESAPKFYSLHLQKHWFSKFLNSPWNIRSQNKKSCSPLHTARRQDTFVITQTFVEQEISFSLRIEIIVLAFSNDATPRSRFPSKCYIVQSSPVDDKEGH